jgi:hypothetical protein
MNLTSLPKNIFIILKSNLFLLFIAIFPDSEQLVLFEKREKYLEERLKKSITI